MPKVSVIIPTYNRANFVTKAIDSVLIQTFKDHEIIVIDDGSTDDTRQALESYEGKIQYVYQNNSGVSAARNAGIRLAKGEWVAFLDSDDEWLPEYLSYQMEGVRQNSHICVHMTNSLIIKDGNIENTFKIFGFLPKFKNDLYIILQRPLYYVIKYHLSFPPSIIAKRDILLKTGLFDIKLTISEDFDLICRLALQGKFGICQKPLVHFHRRMELAQNLSAQRTEKGIYNFESRVMVLENLRNSEKLTFREKLILLNTLSSNRRALANLLLRDGNIEAAKINYKKAFFNYPSFKSFLKYLLSFLPRKVSLWFIWKGTNIKP